MLTCTFENGKQAKLRHVVVHALVEQDGKFLLGRRHPTFVEGGKFGLPGGYMELGETLEQAVLRELMEETGWVGEIVGLLRVNSNPKRSNDDRENIGFDFIVKPIKQTGKPDWESTEISWIPMDVSYPFEALAFDHGSSIKLYLDWKKKQFLIPIIS